MHYKTIAFIGAGNMAKSLIGGLIANGYPADKIIATNPNQEKLKVIGQKFAIRTTRDNKGAVAQAEVVILCVKPHVIKQVTQEVEPLFKEKQMLLISIAAGVRLENLQRWIGEAQPIVRCMPNIAALVAAGVTGLIANSQVSQEQKELAESILRAVGITIWLENENQMDVVTALSGSGPAYFFLFMASLEEEAIRLGLSPQAAHLCTLQTALGAAKIAMESVEDLTELRRQVTSPGGTTERAIHVLDEGHFSKIVANALKAATERAQELQAKVE